MVRLLVAQVLRLITSLGIGLALILTMITLVGIGVALFGDEEAGGFGLADIVPMWLGSVILLLSISRLAYLALGRIVDLSDSADRDLDRR